MEEKFYIAVIICIHWENKDYHVSIDENFSKAVQGAKKIVGNFPLPDQFVRNDNYLWKEKMHECIEFEGWDIEFNIGTL